MKNELPLHDFLNQCKIISDAWPTTEKFADVPISKNPLKETGSNLKERKHWKSSSLYQAIMSNSAFDFWDSNSDIYTETEYDVLCEVVKKSDKVVALDMLKTLLLKLKKRKLRSKKAEV
jgi:hypothetical protein